MDAAFVGLENLQFAQQDEILNRCKNLKDNLNGGFEVLNNLEQRQNDLKSDVHKDEQYRVYISTLKERAANTAENVGQITEHLRLVETAKQTLNKKILENMWATVGIMAQLETKFAQDFKSVSALQNEILNKLAFWKFEQQAVANGFVETLKLDTLQLWCEEQAEIIWNLRDQVKRAERIKVVNPIFRKCKERIHPDTIPELTQKITSFLGQLLQGAFVVMGQPPQVMKQTVRIPTSIKVAHLVLHKLNLLVKDALVSVRFIEESMAKKLKEQPNCAIEEYPGLTIHSRYLEYDSTANIFSASFNSWQWKGFTRPQRRGVGSERVMEDKYALHFETVLSIADMEFKIWTTSLPVVVTSHGSQDDVAVATIMWDNAFGQINREPFVVPTPVTWDELSNVLNQYFLSVTGNGLSSINITTLKSKLFGESPPGEITWSKFCKDNMNGGQFSFWKWCYEALMLIEKYLKEPWRDGYIYGIVNKKEAENLLYTCRPFTFLIRFSDSILGSISASYTDKNGQVRHSEPMDKKVLSLGFAKIVMSVRELQFLYPDISKERAFGRYLEPTLPTTLSPPGYVPLSITFDNSAADKSDISGLPSGSGNNDIPQQTPNPVFTTATSSSISSIVIGTGTDQPVQDMEYDVSIPELLNRFPVFQQFPNDLQGLQIQDSPLPNSFQTLQNQDLELLNLFPEFLNLAGPPS